MSLPEYHPLAFPTLVPVDIPADWDDTEVPHFVDTLLDEAIDRAHELEELRAPASPAAPLDPFVAGDYRYAYQVLVQLLRHRLVAPRATWLEWGSGQGMTTVLAAMLGFRATGVELDLSLVREARALAERYDVPAARFIHGSYRPAGRHLPVLTAAGRDLVYVYPWPGEESFFLRLFEDTASSGALLLVATGPLAISAFRKQ